MCIPFIPKTGHLNQIGDKSLTRSRQSQIKAIIFIMFCFLAFSFYLIENQMVLTTLTRPCKSLMQRYFLELLSPLNQSLAS